MQTYLAFLRGINVGGHSLIRMTELNDALTADGFSEVHTYIQSGNILFKSGATDSDELAKSISAVILKAFKLEVTTVVFSETEWKDVIKSAPVWWGKDASWKHNLLIFTEPYDIDAALAEIGVLKPDIEALHALGRVIYQSVSFKDFGRARSGKLASLPIYKKMTVRNYNTSTKLAALLN